MSKLKIGVFGAARGQTMIDLLLRYPDAELAAVCDKYVPLLDKTREKAEAAGIAPEFYTDFEQFIQADLDAVVLANYANEHAPYAIRLLESGRHVCSEVLPCETMAQAVALIEAAERSGKVYAYAENYCYFNTTFEMRRRYERGDIGEAVYGEGEYIHDCTAIWPQITYGEPEHWRNRMHPFYYNTHSLGPLLAITGLRPTSVAGFCTRPDFSLPAKGIPVGAAAVEMVKAENGALFKSIHGALKREPGSINYELYGAKGCMETRRFGSDELNVYREGDAACVGKLETYVPGFYGASALSASVTGHGGSDFYTVHFFIQKILGAPDGAKYSLDVYRAVDMGICGILAYRSALAGGTPIDVPNLRVPEQRERFRHDTACTTPEAAEGKLLPQNPFGAPPVSPEGCAKIRELWSEGRNFEK